MDDRYILPATEDRIARRHQRDAMRQRRLREQRRRQRKVLLSVLLPLLLLSALLLAVGAANKDKEAEQPAAPAEQPAFTIHEVIDPNPEPPYTIRQTESTVHLGEEFPSAYVVLVDLESGEVLADRDPNARISPASMTKILTLLVAAEQTADRLDDTFTITREITDYCFVNGCSVVGYEVDESATVRDLLYGCILPSGADASMALAHYVAGSHEGFVELMNAKLEELGLSDTAHFTNCVGNYDEEHYCTVKDMALLMKAVLENELCREVICSRTYTTEPMNAYPEGQPLSNWFIRRIEDRDCGSVKVLAGKTGFVNESGSCAVSYAETADGKGFLCVTGNAYNQWRVIDDHAELYRTYCK